jgi:hypothetical protein
MNSFPPNGCLMPEPSAEVLYRVGLSYRRANEQAERDEQI